MFKFNCPKDELVQVFREYGYCLVRLPRTGVQPLQLLARNRDGSYALMGAVGRLFQAHPDYPEPSLPPEKPAPSQILGRESTKLKRSIGLELLGNFTEALGLGDASADIENERVDKISFELHQVKVQEIDFFDLDRFLNRAELDSAAKDSVQKVKNGDLYIISAILKAKAFSIKTYDENEKAIKAIVQDNHEIIGIKGEIGTNQENEHNITYTGEQELIFAFKAAQIKYENSTFRTVEADRGTLKSEEKIPVDLLATEDNFVELA